MTQYCRYCNHLIVGDVAWCESKDKVISENIAKHSNNCKNYMLNEIDAFQENKNGYKSRKKKNKANYDQMYLDL